MQINIFLFLFSLSPLYSLHPTLDTRSIPHHFAHEGAVRALVLIVLKFHVFLAKTNSAHNMRDDGVTIIQYDFA